MTNRPLWLVMHDAFTDHYRQDAYWPGYAAEIRAVRDWLFPHGRSYDEGPSDVMQARLWDRLTTEADRAERGEVK